MPARPAGRRNPLTPRAFVEERPRPQALALAPPPAKAGGGWEGVPTARDDPERHPSPTLPCLRRGGSRARGFRHSYNADDDFKPRSEEHTSELQSLMRIS